MRQWLVSGADSRSVLFHGSWVWAILVGCSACDKPASIEVQPDHPLLVSKGDSLQLRATVKDRSGRSLPGAPVTFRSMTPTMATVDHLGNVQAVTSGAATILVESPPASKEVEVLVQLAKKITIAPRQPMMMLGVTKGFKATVINDRDQPMIAGEIRWSTSDPEIFTVDKDGNVKTLKEGKATLTAHAAGTQGTTEITVKHEELHEDGTLSQ